MYHSQLYLPPPGAVHGTGRGAATAEAAGARETQAVAIATAGRRRVIGTSRYRRRRPYAADRGPEIPGSWDFAEPASILGVDARRSGITLLVLLRRAREVGVRCDRPSARRDGARP